MNIMNFKSARKACRTGGQNAVVVIRKLMLDSHQLGLSSPVSSVLTRSFILNVLLPIAAKFDHIDILDELFETYRQLMLLSDNGNACKHHVSLPDFTLQTCEHIALQRGHVRVLYWLLSHGSKLEDLKFPHCIFNWSAVDVAVRRGTMLNQFSAIGQNWATHVTNCSKIGLLTFLSNQTNVPRYLWYKSRYFQPVVEHLQNLCGSTASSLVLSYAG